MVPIGTNGRDAQGAARGEGSGASTGVQGRLAMWLRHWGLSRDPFADSDPCFVPLRGHAEAVARLVHVVETGQRLAVFQATAGLGKSRVLGQALSECRGPARRIVRISMAAGGESLFARLGQAFGLSLPAEVSAGIAWKQLTDALRVCHWQGLAVVLAIDDCNDLTHRVSQIDLGRLAHLAPSPEMRLTILQVGRPLAEPAAVRSGWELVIRLAPLTRSEAAQYIEAKLAAAGRTARVFEPSALARMHALAEGTPRGLNRLASLSLMAGALERTESIHAALVEGAWHECSTATARN